MSYRHKKTSAAFRHTEVEFYFWLNSYLLSPQPQPLLELLEFSELDFVDFELFEECDPEADLEVLEFFIGRTPLTKLKKIKTYRINDINKFSNSF